MTTSPITTITDELLAELEAAAKAATPGPWVQDAVDDSLYVCERDDDDKAILVVLPYDIGEDGKWQEGQQTTCNYNYTTRANPATILALLAERAELKRDADRLIAAQVMPGFLANPIIDRLQAELESCAATLPGAYYMDPPDGGDVSIPEQLRRMAKDAARYRWLRAQEAERGIAVLTVSGWERAATCWATTFPDPETLDAAIDVAMQEPKP